MSQGKGFNKENCIFGLDIGTRSIIGIVGYPTVTGFNVIADSFLEHETRAMIDGQIYDIEKVTESVKKVKLEIEKKLGFPLKKVCIAAAGRVLKTTTIHVEQAIDQNTTINDDNVFALELFGIEKAHQEVNVDLNGYELGYHCVGYTVTNYFLNNYQISKLQGHKGKTIGADVLATFLPKEVVESLHQVVQHAGLEVSNLTLEPIAAINIAIPKEYRLLNIALIDIGAGTSDIAITKDGSIIAYGMIPLAGDEITEKIIHEYLVDFKTAEVIKIKSSGKSKKVTYKDIMGLQHAVSLDEINSKIRKSAENLAEKIGDKIKELNCGYSTSAVFIVGGGGQLSGFTDLLAKQLDLPLDRVALRGKTVLNNVNFESGRKKTPDIVTPIGICFSGLDSAKREFIEVYLNDEPIKVFDTNKLTVMDIAAYKGINPKQLIARRGSNLTFMFNGIEKIIKGEVGEPSNILINHQPASLNDRIQMNDYIVIIPAKKGKDAQISTHQLFDKIDPIHIQINGISNQYKPKLKLNGTLVTINYDIHNNDLIETVDPTIKEIFNHYQIVYNGQDIKLNNKKQNVKAMVKDNDILTFDQLNSKSPQQEGIKEPNKLLQTICIQVNGQEVILNTKKDYVFVDIFDHFKFDLSQPKGIVVCEINGEKVTYMSPIENGDILKIYWSND
ncbi:MAG: cell division protein FtsA [Firmicutes bacterium HGW-Firmicutes-7]|nr:MAG: cell division protein FtsA [Firmicutes bacterium HGW-Firmicutes-7]